MPSAAVNTHARKANLKRPKEVISQFLRVFIQVLQIALGFMQHLLQSLRAQLRVQFAAHLLPFYLHRNSKISFVLGSGKILFVLGSGKTDQELEIFGRPGILRRFHGACQSGQLVLVAHTLGGVSE